MTLALNLWQTCHQRIAMISLIVVCGINAQCQDSKNIRAPMPEYVQEFFQSDAVRCQEKGEFQLTLATQAHPRGANADLQFEYGLTNRLQTSVEVPYGIRASRDETEISRKWSYINAGLLYQFIRSDRPFAFSAGLMVDLPLHPSGGLGYEPAILLARSFHKLQIHASVLSEVEQWKPSLAYNISAVYPIKTAWFPTFEFNGRRNANRCFYLTPGVYRHLGHRSEMGIGIPIGVGRTANPFGIVLKANWELGGDNEREGTR